METTNNPKQTDTQVEKDYELIHLKKTKKICGLCEQYCSSKTAQNDLTAIISCEGACLRGEVSRRVANKLCFEEFPENTARVCLGSAFTKDTGQRNMVRNAKRVIALEGCTIECASRMMESVIPDLKAEVILVDRYYNFDKKLFAINEATEEELFKFTKEATSNIKKIINP